jgi:hypothetical protein
MNSSTLETAPSQSLTAAELEQARFYLQLTRNYVVGSVKGLSETQWKFKPAPDRWSIAQNLEHMVFIHELVLGSILEKLATAPAPPADRDCKLVDEIVIHQFPDRRNRFNPEIPKPAGDWTLAAALDRLFKNYERSVEFLESTPDLREHVVEAPPLKAATKGVYDSMDGYQWVLAAAAHNERHCKQILEVKSDPAFPAN